MARVSLRLLGESHFFTVPSPAGPAPLTSLLPAARRLSDQTAAIVLDRYRDAGRPSSCKPRCAACCRHLVAVSLPEAVELAELAAAAGPEILVRFAAAVSRLEQAGLLDPDDPPGDRALVIEEQPRRADMVRILSHRYFDLQIPCPFLHEESCRIYDRRPTVCREHHVFSPAENCARPDKHEVLRVETRADMPQALARTAAQFLEEPPRTIPLVLALEWANAHRDQRTRVFDPGELFATFLGAIVPAEGDPVAPPSLPT